MSLSVFERILLLNLLPTDGDITTLRLVRALRESLSFSEDEHKAFAIVNDGQQIKWDETAAKAAAPKSVEIGPVMRQVIVDRFAALNAAKQLQDIQIDLYDRFVPA